MITNSEIEVTICFLIALMLMIAMSFWCVHIRRTASFIASAWLCFAMISGSGFYLAYASLAPWEEKNANEHLNLLVPSSEREMVSDAGQTMSVAFEHVTPSAVPVANGSGVSHFAPVALFQILLVLFFVGVYFAAQNDLFRERISAVREQLQDTTRRWMREKNKSVRRRQMNRTILNNISHEMRTPLNAILGLTQVMQIQRQKSATPCDTDQEIFQEIFDTIQKNGADLIFVIENIILFSSIDSRLVKIHWREIDFLNFLKELKLDIRKKTLWDDSNDPEQQIIVPENFPEKLIFDVYCLRSILLNLWENAIKFSGNTNVYVRFAIRPEDNLPADNPRNASQVPEGEQRFSPAVFAVEVSDSGIGIRNEQIENIFQPFYQVDTSSTRNYNGLGLGLAITKRLTQMLGGEVNVKSEPGKGSQFTLEFPTWIETAREPVKNFPGSQKAVSYA